MLRILQQFILTALFAVFASQASAMFISPDPMDPTGQGVGTNRYAYSGGDPINRMDPSGYAWIDRAFESVFGDGSFDRTFGGGASERMDRIADSVFGNSADRAASSAYGTYASGGGSLGYDAWRFSTGNFTRSLTNDVHYSSSPTRLSFGADSGTAPNDPFHNAVAMSSLLAGFSATMAERYPNAYARNNRTVAALAAAGYSNINIVIALSGTPGTSPSYMTRGQKEIYNDITGRAVGMGVFGSIHNASQQRGYGTHAETKALGFAQVRGFSPIALGASRPICPNCSAFITTSGGTLVGPRIAIWP